MEKRVRFSIWYFVGAFALVVLLHTYLIQEQASQITYSQFKQLVRTAKVSEVVLGPDYLTGKLVNTNVEGILPASQVEQLRQLGGGQPYVRAVRVEDPKLIEELEAQHIPYSGRLASTWLTELM